VFLSGVVAGLVYGRIAINDGIAAASRRILATSNYHLWPTPFNYFGMMAAKAGLLVAKFGAMLQRYHRNCNTTVD